MNKKQNRIALIPARLESQRLPEKLLLLLAGKPIVVKTYEAVLATELFDKVVVICNHKKIAEKLSEHNCEFVLTDKHFESGTDRIAYELDKFPHSIIVNVQADEPFVQKEELEKLISLMDDEKVDVGTLKCELKSAEDIANPNNVKITSNQKGRALYFSRSPIPFSRDIDHQMPTYKHIGVYAYKRSVLQALCQISPSQLELAEKLENLRMIENGFYVSVAEINKPPMSIDTQEDYERAIRYVDNS